MIQLWFLYKCLVVSHWSILPIALVFRRFTPVWLDVEFAFFMSSFFRMPASNYSYLYWVMKMWSHITSRLSLPHVLCLLFLEKLDIFYFNLFRDFCCTVDNFLKSILLLIDPIFSSLKHTFLLYILVIFQLKKLKIFQISLTFFVLTCFESSLLSLTALCMFVYILLCDVLLIWRVKWLLESFTHLLFTHLLFTHLLIGLD